MEQMATQVNNLRMADAPKTVQGLLQKEIYLCSQLLKQMKRSGAGVHNLRIRILEPLLVPTHALALKRMA